MLNYQVLLGRLHFKFAEKYLLINQVNNAKEKFDECIKIRTQILGADSIGVGLVMGNIGYLFQLQKDYTNAVNYYEKTLKILYKYLPKNHINIIKLHTNLGVAYYCAKTLHNHINLSNRHFEIAKSNAEFLQLDDKNDSNKYKILSTQHIEKFLNSFANEDVPFMHLANDAGDFTFWEKDHTSIIANDPKCCFFSISEDLYGKNENNDEDK